MSSSQYLRQRLLLIQSLLKGMLSRQEYLDALQDLGQRMGISHDTGPEGDHDTLRMRPDLVEPWRDTFRQRN